MSTATKNGTATGRQSEIATIVVPSVETATIRVPIRGVRPVILNRLSEKARHDLLMPAPRKTAADKAANLKHDPLAEFRAAPYLMPHEDDPTLLGLPASAFKGSMMTAALRVPGARKTEIGQLLWIEGDFVPVYGIPRIFLAITRSADMNRTPDVRTRAIVPAWATEIRVTFATPMLNETSVVNLLAAAGLFSGVGDWRPEKGKGTFGQFALTNDDDDEMYEGIVSHGGRAAQVAAMADPEPYDAESEELLGWFTGELTRRGKGAQVKGH